MIVKCAYYLELFTIIAITTVLLASIEAAPDHPGIFTLVLLLVLIADRKLWRMAMKTGNVHKEQTVSRRLAVPKKSMLHSKNKAA